MSSTRIFIQPENDDDYNYFKKIEDEDYFRPIASLKHDRVGNFRVHGKYISTFHPGRRFPNEYYCKAEEAMVLRSGRKLNYFSNTSCFEDLNDVSGTFDGTPERRCLSVKKLIWGYENYYHILSTSYHLAPLYDISRLKIKEFIRELEKSVKAVYKERSYRVANDDDGVVYHIDYTEPMPERDTGVGNYTFCNCRYTFVDGGRAFDQWGHHLDELLPKLKKLDKIFSKPHRIIKDSDVFNFINKKINDDCRRLIFSFLKADDIKDVTTYACCPSHSHLSAQHSSIPTAPPSVVALMLRSCRWCRRLGRLDPTLMRRNNHNHQQ